MGTTEVVNAFCNMTGASLNETQREALERLIQGIYDSGVKNGSDRELESNIKEHDIKCDGCSSVGLALVSATLKHFNGDGMYCVYCLKVNGEHDIERLRPTEKIQDYDQIGEKS